MLGRGCHDLRLTGSDVAGPAARSVSVIVVRSRTGVVLVALRLRIMEEVVTPYNDRFQKA